MTNTVTRDPKTGALMIDGVKIETLAKRYGTPLYVYSHERLIENYRTVAEAFAPVNPLIAFSMKSNSSGAILRSLINEGCGLDIVSGGELARGIRAGADPKKIIYAGVGKTREEIAQAVVTGIRAFNVESEPEAEAIGEVASRLRRTADVALRVNPDVDAATHHYITTGKKENKFGIAYENIRKLFKKLARFDSLRLVGIHAHIGSQILKPEGYVKALERLAELYDLLRKDGHELEIFNFGGGFGIAYQDDQQPMDVAALAKKLIPTLQSLEAQIIFEPGRFIIGPAGFLVTQVQYIKCGDAKNFAIIDGGMNDLIRPSLYSAYHRILLDGQKRRGKAVTYDVVGPICESGDFLGKDREFTGLAEGDLLLVCDAGAYGMAMASNYNSRPRPAEVMIAGKKHELIRERETIEDLVRQEVVPEFLKCAANGKSEKNGKSAAPAKAAKPAAKSAKTIKSAKK